LDREAVPVPVGDRDARIFVEIAKRVPNLAGASLEHLFLEPVALDLRIAARLGPFLQLQDVGAAPEPDDIVGKLELAPRRGQELVLGERELAEEGELVEVGDELFEGGHGSVWLSEVSAYRR